MAKINPKILKNIFTDEIIDALPTNDKIAYGVAATKRMQNPLTKQRLSQSRALQNTPEYLNHMSKQRFDSMDEIINDEGQTLREVLTEANQISAKNPEHYANRCAANKKLKEEQYWKDAHAVGVLSYSEKTMTPMGVYCSMSKWMNEFDKPGGRSYLKSLPHLFYQIKNGPGEITYERIYNTPFGKCASEKHAYSLAQHNKEPNSIKLKNISGWWIKMAALFSDQYYLTFETAKYWGLEKDIPYGMLELDHKPRISKDKLEKVIKTWNDRIKNQRTLYKQK